MRQGLNFEGEDITTFDGLYGYSMTLSFFETCLGEKLQIIFN